MLIFKSLFLLLFIHIVSSYDSLKQPITQNLKNFRQLQQQFKIQKKTKQQYQKNQIEIDQVLKKQTHPDNLSTKKNASQLDSYDGKQSTNLSIKLNFNFRNVQKINQQIYQIISNNFQKSQLRLLTELIPSTFDWRNHKDFSSVSNLGACGANQLFALTAFFQQELIAAGLSDKSINFSEMYLKNCNPEKSDCTLGSVEPLMDMVLKKGGLPLESQYPFSIFASPEKICFEKNLVSLPSGNSRVSHYDIKDPEKIKEIILKKPAIASVCGTDMTFYFPDQSDPSSRTLRCSPHNRIRDHHVLLVGYTETEWIVKNTWGEGWGIGGYGYISKKKGEDCCIGGEIHTTGKKSTECSVIYCQSCVQQQFCSNCEGGRYVSYNSLTGIQTCEECKQLFCNQCQNYKGTCKLCSQGYSINSETNKCAFSTITNCNKIQNSLCVQCKPGYQLSEDKSRCVQNCEVINCLKCPQGPCLSCKNGYNMLTPTVNGKKIEVCKLNTCAVSNCSLCNSSGQCIKCKNGYLFNSSNSQCYSNCLITDCISCKTDPNTCEICFDGKSWNKVTKVCQAFPATANCKQFNDTCIECKLGYRLQKQKSGSFLCIQLCQQQSCSQCLQNDLSYCNTCIEGYFLEVTQYSSKCVKNLCAISGCSLCNTDGTECVKCENEFFVFNFTANQCENQCTLSNCKGCLPGDSICSQCSQGYAFNTDNDTCVELVIQNCVKVYYAGANTLQQFCLECRDNFKVLQTADSFDKQCVFDCKVSNCQKCNEQKPHVCEKCISNMYPQMVNGSIKCSYPRKNFQNCAFPSLNQSYCFQCEQFYFMNQLTGLCELHTQNCPATCLYCTPPEYKGVFSCKCKNGLFFNKVQKQCTPNPFEDKNCIAGSHSPSYSYCANCLQGMTVNYTSWKSCVSGCHVSNCKSCAYKNYLVCQTCESGYYLNYRLECSKCTISDLNCQICFYSKCVECKKGYRLDPSGIKCNPIKCNDKQIYDGLNCVCPAGSYYGNNTCEICHQQNCQFCSNQTCFICLSGFYLLNSQCEKCIQNCQLCNSSQNCHKCQDGFYFDTNLNLCISLLQIQKFFQASQNQAATCPQNCQNCTLQSTCTKCLDNYQLIKVKCQSCLNNCKTCLKTNMAVCFSCYAGYHLTKSKDCIRCHDKNCKDCSISQKYCVSCLKGYFVDQGSCKLCQTQGCSQCNNLGQCKECQSGYVLMDDHSCELCGGNCSSCNSNAINQCLVVCNSSSYLSDGECIRCPQGCQKCLSHQLCIQCEKGYQFRNGECKKTCQAGCYQCNQQNPSLCQKCFNSYILLTNGTCQQNITCNADSSCTVCPEKRVLINGKCKTCLTETYCLQCSDRNLSFCEKCKDGFYVSGGTCKECQKNCQKCISSDSCQICKDGYFKPVDIILGSCLKCDPMCETCFGFSQGCKTCRKGYELSSTNKCLRRLKIQGTIKLDIELSEFHQKSKMIRSSILRCIGEEYENEIKHYVILQLKQGSTILRFSLSIPDVLDEMETIQHFRVNLASLGQLGGVDIISTSSVQLIDGNVVVNQQDEDHQDHQNHEEHHQNEESASQMNLAIILGVVIPVSVAVLILLGCFIKRKLQSQKIVIEEHIGIEQFSHNQQKTRNPHFERTGEFSVISQTKKEHQNQSITHQRVSIASQESNQRLKNVENASTVILVKKRKKSKRNSSTINPSDNKHLNFIENFIDQSPQKDDDKQ